MDTVRWLDKENCFEMIDQTILPHKFKYIKMKTVEAAARSIEIMQVRGAPAIGVTAAMGMALGAVKFRGNDKEKFIRYMDEIAHRLARTRPTAVNLFWAIDRMKGVIARWEKKDVETISKKLIAEAKNIDSEDVASCKAMGKLGATLLRKNSNVLTHCNAGSLATADYGTALGVIRAGYAAGKVKHVYADETRPRLQGAKLTAFEMAYEKIPCSVICDNNAANMMARGRIDAVIVGSDRIAGNGDVANKIGTYSLAVVSKYHGIPFYVAAPMSTVDYTLTGKDIPIEERDGDEVRMIGREKICPDEVGVVNYAFDVTPAKLITAIITEKGIAMPPSKKTMAALRDK